MAKEEKNVKKFNFKLVDFLNGELKKKQLSNPKYSLRQFAKELGYESSFFSKILRGVSPLTEEQFLKITSLLSISIDEKNAFYEDILHETERVNRWHHKGKELAPVNKESFSSISHWYHDVILCMVNLDNFSNDPKKISEKLGLSESQVKSAIADLVLHNLLALTDTGELRPPSTLLLTETPGASDIDFKAELKKHTIEIMEKGIEIIKAEPLENFSCGSLTMTIDSELKKEMMTRSREFIKSLTIEIEERSLKKDCVLELTFGLFPWVWMD